MGIESVRVRNQSPTAEQRRTAMGTVGRVMHLGRLGKTPGGAIHAVKLLKMVINSGFSHEKWWIFP